MRRYHELIAEAASALGCGCGRGGRALAALRLVGDPDGDADQRLAASFTRAFEARLGIEQRGGGNLYLEHDGSGQDGGSMLAAFGLLAERTPLIAFGYASANRALCEVLDHADEIDIIDIGVGLGGQWRSMLDELGRRSAHPPHLRLTGIDLPAAGEDPLRTLRDVGRVLHREARAAGVPFSWQPIAKPVDDLEFPCSWAGRRPLAVNAAFSLHHLPDAADGSAASATRDHVLQRLRALHPAVLTLVEPDADHNGLPFVARVLEAHRHYSLVFDIFEELLPRGCRLRALLERDFFGREVRNVVASEGAERVERHERLTSWRRRLRHDGFSPIPLEPHVDGLREALRLSEPFSIGADEGAMCLSWKGERLLATTAWRPQAA